MIRTQGLDVPSVVRYSSTSEQHGSEPPQTSETPGDVVAQPGTNG